MSSQLRCWLGDAWKREAARGQADHHTGMENQGVRLPWEDVARHIREEVASVLGSEVVSAANQPGGFSPGVAARCRLADGRRYFIKAVSADQNPMSPHLHRREGKVAAALPPGLPIPKLVAVVDDGHWVVLVFEEVDGHPPRQPWTLEELAATFAALDDRAALTTPSPVPGLVAFAQLHADGLDGYRRLAGGDPLSERVDTWSRRHLDRLAQLEAGYPAASEGQTLLHSDLRADNLLVRADGSVIIVDWPGACVGAAWVDKALMLPSVGLSGGPSPAQIEQALDPFAGVDPEAVNAVVVALAGYFTYSGAQPDPPGLPTVRAFQRAQAAVTRAWLQERLGLR